MDKLKMHSKDKTQENFEILQRLFPNAVTETITGYDEDGKAIVERAIDKDVLQQEINAAVVEGKDERYQFTWPDKKRAIVSANAPINKTLRPCREESVNFDTTENLYIEGDNLEVLKLLQETYLGKIKMIYIDPPYNTGHDFVYNDKFSVSADEWDEMSGELDEYGNRLTQNTESNGRFHTDWLNMIYPRLKIARELLTDDGLIFISIDDNEVENLKKICDEVFGAINFVAQIALLCNPKGRSQDKYIANCHEYILIYSRCILSPGCLSIPKTESEINADYPLSDDHGAYRELELRNTHRDFGKFNRPKLWYPIYAREDGRVVLNEEPDTEAVFPVWDDGFEGCWTWGKEKTSKNLPLLVAKMVNGKRKIYRKAYAYSEDIAPHKQVKSIWTDKMFFTEKGQLVFNSLYHTKEKFFQSPKSVYMIEQCVQMCQSHEAIILDFFSGSATTAHAVMRQNFQDVFDGIKGKRKFIMVQLPEKTDEKSEAHKAGYKNICEIGKERIRRAAELEKKNVYATAGSSLKWNEERKAELGEDYVCPEDVDIGFRVLKLDESNMKDVYYNPADFNRSLLDTTIDNIKEDRTPEDLLFQVMLDLGVLLSSKIEGTEIAGKKVFNVADGFLIACFDNDVNEEVITAVAKQHPIYFVMRDRSLSTDTTATNFDQIFETYSPDTVRKVI